ncbi:MAG: hypothetical protein ABWY13_16805 [Mesorhizobium sp.]|jgi:hypothetical protein
MGVLYVEMLGKTTHSDHMDPMTFEAASPSAGAREDLPHLAGPAAAIRQVLAAHFLRDCPHVVEIGGHTRPITGYLTHRPLSVLSVDPKTDPFEEEELNGHPCRVRHIAQKFQQVTYDYAPRSYGLVLLGYSLKPFGMHEPLGQLLFSLIDNARTVVIEYPPALDRATSQVPAIISRPNLRIYCSFELLLDDEAIAGSPYAKRQFYVLLPAG